MERRTEKATTEVRSHDSWHRIKHNPYIFVDRVGRIVLQTGLIANTGGILEGDDDESLVACPPRVER